MRRILEGGFELDDDPSRVDVDAVWRFLSEDSYWAAGRPRADVERLVAEASRVVGLYDGKRQIGFTRTTCCGGTAFLYDVYVLPEYRGRGLGIELVRETVENGPFAADLWLLRTADAHELYRRFGFGEPDALWMVRPRPGD